jgi:FlaA1/EpsC-like NDP-sugar epimerase
VVFHAAAHKHVPLMEANIEEAITNNILGTRNVVEVALDYDVERLVMISTDKAIHPSSVMGAAKRFAELLVLDAAQRSGEAFSVVRFGNVLGSRGSVVPLFKRQIVSGGPVTVTHPDMKRYFMTIPEAVHLVLQTSSMQQGGEVYVLNMGEQVRILDLVEDLIRLSGLEPGKDIEIIFTGIRPGEKMSEELWDQTGHYEPTTHKDINRLVEDVTLSGDQLNVFVDELIHLAREGDSEAIIRILDEAIPGSALRSIPPSDMSSYV